MSNTDKRIRELIIDKFMGTSRTVITDYQDKENPAEIHMENIIPEGDVEQIASDDTPDDSLVDHEDDASDTESIEETYDYLTDEPLNHEFRFDTNKQEPIKLAICLYRLNRDGKIPFLEFYCQKEDAMYSFPSAVLDTLKMREMLVDETKDTNLELAAPAAALVALDNEQAKLEDENGVEAVVQEPVLQEPVEPFVQEEEPVETFESVEPIVQEPVVQEQEPVLQEEEPVEPVEPVVQEEEPVLQEPVEPVVQEPVEPVVQEPVVQEPVEPVVLGQEPVLQETFEQGQEPVLQETFDQGQEPVLQETFDQGQEPQENMNEPLEIIQPSDNKQQGGDDIDKPDDFQDANMGQDTNANQQDTNTNQQDEMDTQDITSLFLKQAYQLFQSTTQQPLEIAGEKYKGYVSLTGNTYIAVFDYNEMELLAQDDSIWATLYEIKSKTRILDIPVAEFTYQLFHESPDMSYIKNSENRAIEIPRVVYICEEKDGGYDNSYYIESENREQSSSMINTRTTHPVLGNCFLFTTEPFEINNLSKIKRYALFSMDAIYLLNKDIDLIEYQSTDLKEYESICFYENGVEYWAIENSDLFTEI
jgi:hypothetical protein